MTKPFPKSFVLNSYASRIAMFYVAFSVVWVILSDAFVAAIFGGPPVAWRVELIAGLIYALITGAVLYGLFHQQEQRSEGALHATEQQLRRLVESELIGICFWQTNGVITNASDTFLNMLGYSRSDLAAGTIRWDRIMVPSPDLDEMIRTELKVRGRSSNYERELTKRDGTRIWVVAGAALLDGPTNIGIGYALDISEAKQLQVQRAELEDQLRQAQKLQAIGQLAGGVAHDFNNILNIIVGYTSLVEATLNSEDQRRHSTQQVLKAASKASALVSKLLAFGRRRLLRITPVDLSAVLNELGEMLTRLINEDIELSIRTEGQGQHVQADSTQLEQIVINLVVNARDAMPNGGKIEISTSGVWLSEKEAQRFGIEPGRYIQLAVRDSGTGMDEETKSHIFEPFFSTKPDHAGAGLWLATVYGIVKQCGGHIRVESKLREGSTFIVYLACLDSAVADIPVVEKAARRDSPSPRAGTILVAEDDDEVRTIVRHILELDGYRVLEAKDGEQAVAVATEFDGAINLIVTDVRMPRSSGPEAVFQIRQNRPEIKVIYISGYIGDSTLPSGTLSEPDAVLDKPILPEVLLRRVREVLDTE